MAITGWSSLQIAELSPSCLLGLCTERAWWQSSGATGLVGTSLVSKLLSLGHTVRVLTRDPGKARRKLPQQCICYAPENWSDAVKGATAVVNLAGMPT